MRRRELLKAAAAAAFAAGLAPSIVRAERAKTLTFVPVGDLAVLDPVVTFNRPTRNYAYLVFDTLYGLDTEWTAQPQMVEGHEVSSDGLAWTLKLRDGLRFHDGEPVLARDAAASIRRFAPRISFASGPDGGHRRIVGAGRPHRAVPPETAVPASAGGAWPAPAAPCRRSCPSGSPPTSSVQTGRRSGRQRPLPLSQGRACQRRPRRLRALRRVPAASTAPRASPRARRWRISTGSSG